MIIDFHNHIFPDGVAARALAKLIESSGGIYPPVHDGTLAGLRGNMDRLGVDVAVILPVLTKASQFRSINTWAQGICSDRIVSFGAIDVHAEDYKGQIDFVVGLGLKGLKFHAEYQDFVVDDERMLRIYDYALDKGLILLHHAGFDPGFRPPFKSSPQQFARIVKAMRGGTIIAAHLGGHAQWDDVERYLVGTDIYLDTSMGFAFYPTEQFLRIVRGHGADKVLFATDSPWSDAGQEMASLRALPLTQAEKDAILGGNAMRLLGL